jgi:hypothetical protein
MTGNTPRQPRIRFRRSLAVGTAAALVLAAGCAQQSDHDLETAQPAGFSATPGYVGKVIDASSSKTYRYKMSFSFGMGGQSVDADLATGAYDGERSQTKIDYAQLFDAMGQGLGEPLPSGLDKNADLTMEQVTDGKTIYIRAPFFSAMKDALPSGSLDDQAGGAIFDVFDQLGDHWGKVDVAGLGDVLPDQAEAALAGGQSADPKIYLDMLRDTGHVSDLGTKTIDGVQAHGLAAQVDFGDLMKAAGTDPSQLPGGSASKVAGAMASMTFPLEVWVDRDDHVRRLGFSFTPETFSKALGEQGDGGESEPGDVPDELSGFEIGMTMDFSDYGDDSIKVATPSDAVDITDEFASALQDSTGG